MFFKNNGHHWFLGHKHPLLRVSYEAITEWFVETSPPSIHAETQPQTTKRHAAMVYVAHDNNHILSIVGFLPHCFCLLSDGDLHRSIPRLASPHLRSETVRVYVNNEICTQVIFIPDKLSIIQNVLWFRK